MGEKGKKMEEEVMKYTIKDSVFTSLFKEKKYPIQLYKAIHPEDTEATEDDLQDVTVGNVLVNDIYNDIVFRIGPTLLILIESQSTWTSNIIFRALMYLVQTYYVSQSKAFLDSLSVDTQDILTYGLIGIVILLACILVIYGVFYLSVIGKIHQFGQLRTIGMTKKQMKKLVLKEGHRLFLYAFPIGILIGGIAGYFIIPSGFSIINTLLMTVCVFAIVYIITMISVYKPAKLAAAVSPMEAMRYVAQDEMKQTENRKMCRSLTPLGLGVMNFSKNKKKAAITMLSLALGGILFMTAATFMSSFDRNNYARQCIWKEAEFHIKYSDSAIELNENGISGLQVQTPMTEQMVQEISAIDGVEKVEELKNFGVRFDYPKYDEYDNNDYIYPLNNEEIKGLSKYIEEGTADYDKLMSGDYILAADNDNAEDIYG